MDIVTLDFETYYSNDYSLRRMTNEEYIRDPRFQVLGVGVKTNGRPGVWVRAQEWPTLLDSLGLRDKIRRSALLCHHAHFDGLILAHHFGVVPALYLCTLSMSRALGNLKNGLGDLADAYGIGRKGGELELVRGMRLEEIPPPVLAQLGEYCRNDVELTWQLWCVFKSQFPPMEVRSIDQTVRMYTEPCIEVDTHVLSEYIHTLNRKRDALLDSVGAGLTSLRSNDQFAALLRERGVAPPTKEGKRGVTYAFAKTDEGLKALLEHPDPDVQMLVEARMGVKSSIEHSRCERLIGAGKRGPLPIYLYYAGAQTTLRFSGGDKLNLQNLPKKTRDGETHPIRVALRAPQGYSLVVADSSQIEARVLAWLAGQDNVIEAFAQGRDVYSEAASVLYGRYIDRKKNPEDKVPGFVGKVVTLALGYGMGFIKAANTFLQGALGGPPLLFGEAEAYAFGGNPSIFIAQNKGLVERIVEAQPPTLTEQEWLFHCIACHAVVRKFRDANPMIVRLWSVAEHALHVVLNGSEPFAFGANDAVVAVPGVGVRLPNGMHIYYKDLEFKDRRDTEEGERGGFFYTGRKEGRIQRINLYGGKAVENVVQALAALIVREQMLTIGGRYKVLFQVHDEIVSLVRNGGETEALGWMVEKMSTPPMWAPGLPLAAEGDWGACYGDAK